MGSVPLLVVSGGSAALPQCTARAPSHLACHGTRP